ncbi:hypothetical protein PG988_004430 [Apiospora saccharicola]
MSQPPEQGVQPGNAQDHPGAEEVSGPQSVKTFLDRFAADIHNLIDNQDKATGFIDKITDRFSELELKTEAKVTALENELAVQKALITNNIHGLASNSNANMDIERRLQALDVKMERVKAGLEAELAQQRPSLRDAINEQINYDKDYKSDTEGRIVQLQMQINALQYAQTLPPAATPAAAPLAAPAQSPAAASMSATPTPNPPFVSFNRRRASATAAAASDIAANVSTPAIYAPCWNSFDSGPGSSSFLYA